MYIPFQLQRRMGTGLFIPTAALAVIEATVRLLPAALGDATSAECDSFEGCLLDWPHYTRPAEWRGRPVPEVLLSGDHGRIRRWRRKEALRATRARRPDLFAAARLAVEDGLFRLDLVMGRPC